LLDRRDSVAHPVPTSRASVSGYRIGEKQSETRSDFQLSSVAGTKEALRCAMWHMSATGRTRPMRARLHAYECPLRSESGQAHASICPLPANNSGGGGAEGVSEVEARDAIWRDDRIAIQSSNSLFNFSAIRFAQPPEIPDTSFRIQMGYRQAGMFVTFLNSSKPDGFGRMMNAILDDRPFVEAVATGYGTDLQTLWLRFVRAMPTAR